ncbi:hypothetical protein [Benzoatithermus flavus]|uniref:Transglycosylase SLT domain-containing protein n=1 Tax=Benzoatithermus flavus TaxID=3108223 RepID=A0ABU8XMP7_9PROT
MTVVTPALVFVLVFLSAASAALAVERFPTLPPGAPLPSPAACVLQVQPYAEREHRPANARYNARQGNRIAFIHGASHAYNQRWAPRVDGRFTGTTEQILLWAACKWGISGDLIRSMAVVESGWRMDQGGDFTTDVTFCTLIGGRSPCAQSYGIMQIKVSFHPVWPLARLSTAMNSDYGAAWLRACFVGDFRWLGHSYRAGDIWGCVGAYYAGEWYSDAAEAYIHRVRQQMIERIWERPDF